MAAVIHSLAARLEQQNAQGNKFFIDNQLSTRDIDWATFAALIQPLPEEQCPMTSAFRAFHMTTYPVVVATPSALLEHRAFIYQEQLERPMVS